MTKAAQHKIAPKLDPMLIGLSNDQRFQVIINNFSLMVTCFDQINERLDEQVPETREHKALLILGELEGWTLDGRDDYRTPEQLVGDMQSLAGLIRREQQ